MSISSQWPLPELAENRELPRRCNYTAWATRMTSILILGGHEYIVDHCRDYHGSEPDKDGTNSDEWRRKNAYAMLIFDLNTLGDANAIVFGGRPTKEVWRPLRKLVAMVTGKAEEKEKLDLSGRRGIVVSIMAETRGWDHRRFWEQHNDGMRLM